MSQTQGISPVFTATPNSGDRFDYTQWRQKGLPKISLKELAAAATKESIMQSQRLILETNDRGNLKQVPKLPPNQQF